MLIIFDLDDTLIDTSGSITPWVFKAALDAMQKKGLSLPSPREAWEEILRINTLSSSSYEALERFLNGVGAPRMFYAIGREVLEDPAALPEDITLIKGALELLKELAQSHSLGLVTRGKEKRQREKMTRAGIGKDFFSQLYFCDGVGKKKAYQKMGKWGRYAPTNTLVCGDRISFDLSPAKELGYTTVQLKQGRGAGNTGLKKDVDYTILHLSEIKKVLKRLK